jgi:ABC-type transport system involved in cytochrome c biogenesis permease subunit
VLTAFGAVAVRLNRSWARGLVVWVVPVFAGVSVFFSFLLVAVASPFATQVAPPDGAGMTPSLQNPYMLAHPPLLYLGYVGLTVPFAFAMGALLSGQLDERWLVATRRFTLFAWTALGIGQLLGAHWAYVEVGWGGYYAWDPVENAALMPWLAATAFLHSVMIQERRGMLRIWNVLLVVLAFSLSLFGTFLTRSGVVNSIHSFTQSSIGPWFLAFIAIVVAFSLALVFWRLRAPLADKLESPIARGGVPLQQPAAPRALSGDPLGRRVSDAVRGNSRRSGRPRALVLRLLPSSLRAPASPADGNRAARRLAESLPSGLGHDVSLADRRSRGDRAVLVLGRKLVPGSSRTRSRPSCCDDRARSSPAGRWRKALGRVVAGASRSSRATVGGTAATSSRRDRVARDRDVAGSSAFDSSRRRSSRGSR